MSLEGIADALSEAAHSAWLRGRRVGFIEGLLVGATIGAVAVLLFGH